MKKMITNKQQDRALTPPENVASLPDGLQHWLADKLGRDDYVVQPAFANIDSPTYFRITIAGETHLLIDASLVAPGHANYSRISGLLRAAKVNAPEVRAEDSNRGFYLLGDIGYETYSEALNESNADSLLRDARTTLINWQLASRAHKLPACDAAFLRAELEQFSHHYIAGHLGVALTAEQQQTLEKMFDLIVAATATQPKVYVHRDYVPDNLIASVIASTPGPGVLGFQGAMFGAISYDVVSLYKNTAVLCDEERTLDGMIRYWESAKKANLPVPADFSDFYRDAEWMGLQRHLKLIASSAQKSTQEKSKKPGEVTELIRYVRRVGERYVALFPLIRLFDKLNINDGIPRTVGISF
jgi:N-acetylmuramate 1-kinase